ncbi:MAG: deoxyribose-phosphate aldolase, partial [Dialister sp.]|nr:deoxyribose-phosphate aldolase [Dialister sp.]
IRRMKELVGDKILKVIVETCYLTEEEKIEACRCVTRGGADYIKTSTGFGTGGATLDDVALFKKYIGPAVKIKASGGIHTKEEMEAYLALGVDRIGASSAIKALTGVK